MSKHQDKSNKKHTEKKWDKKNQNTSKWPDLKNTIQVCNGKACAGRFSEYIKTRLESDKKFYDLPNVDVVNCPCTGNCKVGPSVIYGNEEVSIYMDPPKASKAMVEKFKKWKSTSTTKATKNTQY